VVDKELTLLVLLKKNFLGRGHSPLPRPLTLPVFIVNTVGLEKNTLLSFNYFHYIDAYRSVVLLFASRHQNVHQWDLLEAAVAVQEDVHGELHERMAHHFEGAVEEPRLCTRQEP